ncbi:hypothetical protein IWX90DRAFT_418956 [Phyllosticta citrichinensis]|uniref:Uncharacterized protein n=1 Tax=Phyllosticta citrichinensis TaxID=1130410 RepID=A0ABR1XGU2_9PEZI
MYPGTGRGRGLGRGRPNRQLEHLDFLEDDFLSSQWPERLQSSRASRNYQFFPGSTTWRSRLPPRVFVPPVRDNTGPTSARSAPGLLQRSENSSNLRGVGQARQRLRNTAARLPPRRSPRHNLFPQTPNSGSFGPPPASTRRVQFNVPSATPPVSRNEAMSEYFRRVSTARAETRPYRIPGTPRSAPRTDHEPPLPIPRQRGRGRDRCSEQGPSVPVGQSPRPSSLRIPRTPAGNTPSSRLERYDLDEDTAVTTPLATRLRTRRSEPSAEPVTTSTSYPKPRSSGRIAKPKKKQDPEERSYVPKTAEYEENSDAVDGEAFTTGRRSRSSDRKGRGRTSNDRDDWPWPSVPVGQSPPPPWLRRPAPTAYTPAPPTAKKSRKRKQDASYRPDKASDSDGDIIMMSPPGKRRKVRKAAADVKTATTGYPKPSSSGRKSKGRTKPKPEELSYVPESPEDEDEPNAGPATSKTRGSGRKRKTKESDRSFVPIVETEDEDDDVVESKITSRSTRSKSRSIPEDDDDDDDDDDEQGDLDLATADNEAAWDNIINSPPFGRRITPQQARLFYPSQGWASRPPNTPFPRSLVLPDAQDDHDTDGNDGDEQDDSQSVVDLASEDIDAAWDDVFSRSSPSNDTNGSDGDEQDESQSVVDLASEDIDAAWDDVFSRSSHSQSTDEDDDDNQDDSQSVVDLASEDVDAAWDDIISRTSPPRTRVAPWQPRGPRVYPFQTYRALGGGPLNRHFNMDLTLPDEEDEDQDMGNKGASDVVTVINSPSSTSLSSSSDDEDADDADGDDYHTAPTTPVRTNARKRKAAEVVDHAYDDEVTASCPKPARRGPLPKPIRVADFTENEEATESSLKSTRRRGRPSKTKAASITASGPKPARSGRQSKPENKNVAAPPEPSKRRRPSRLSHVDVGTAAAAAAAPAQTPDAAGDAADSDAPSTRTRGAAKRRASAAPEAASAPKAKKRKQAESKTQKKPQQKTQQKKPQPASASGTRRSTRSRKTT